MKRFYWVHLGMGLLLVGTASGQNLCSQCGDNTKKQVENVDSSHANYAIDMGGKIDGPMTRDPIGYWAYDQYWEPNIRVTMENIGDTPVVNPWLQRADTMDTRTLKSIVDSIVTPGMSDKEKARRIWEFEINNRFHATTQDNEVADVVKRVNVYGYTLCYDESKDISDLWRAAGLKVRKGYPTGHSLAEVYYDGGWHELDSDESIISLLRDNETIASESQIVADHDLMKRTHTYGVLAPDNRLGDEGGAALIYWEGERSGEQPSLTRHTMDFTLRPQESITWAWNPAGRFHAMPYPSDPGSKDPNQWNKRWRVIAHAMDGDTIYAPDLAKQSTLQYLQTANVVQRLPGKFGPGLYLTGSAGTVDVPVNTAYPVVGGRLIVDLARQNVNDDAIAVSISFDGGSTWKDAQTSFASDYDRMYVDLNPFFPQTDPARYHYVLRFTLSSHSEKPEVALKGFALHSTLEMAPLAMPGVVLGENHFIFSDDSRSGTKVRITHVWKECDGNVAIPAAPVAVAPAAGKTYFGTQVKFAWRPGSAVAPVDYQFQLSEFPDMRWPLSPNFNKLISRTAFQGTPTFELPYVGLLNPEQKYYWHVRARSTDHVWGPWSKTYEFSTIAPAVPVDVKANFNRADRAVQLSWQRGKNGAQPVGYRIYGSEERGFTAHDNRYQYNDGLHGTQWAASNLLLDTHNANESVSLPEALWRPYYRVVAVDEKGRLSGPSAMAELSHPLIATSQLPNAIGSQFYEARIVTSASIGHLVSADENGKPYQMKFRTGDELVFDMSGAPAGLSIDNRGVISGFVGDAKPAKYKVTINVKNSKNGAGDSVTLPLSMVGKQ
ncbi:MAG: putative Ig domain-containing protein [Acidobacteriaceae bacterium]